MSIGQPLREARQRLGLSLRDLEETTKIRTHYLKALEDENFSELPGQTYVMGFIRTYARALGLDPQELVDAYKATISVPENVIKPMEPVAPPITKKTYSLQRGMVIGGLCVLALLTLWGMNKVWKGDKSPTPVEPVSKAPAVSKPTTPVQTPGPTPGQTPGQTQGQTPTPAPTTTESAPAGSDQLSLDITFTDKCWLIIKADGQDAFQGTVQAGQTKNIKAKDKIEFPTIGNAGALQLTLNGKPLPSLGGSGAVVKNKVYTKSDIPQ